MFRKTYLLLILAALTAMLWLGACEWMKFPPAPVCQKQENEPVKTADVSTEDEADCVLTDDGTVEYRGRFRHRWWNYYKRAMCFAEKGCWEQAIKDFEKAIEQRGKDEKDQRDARTYGMRFMDYFPRREMGIAYYYQTEYLKALTLLKKSLEQTPTSKTLLYIERSCEELPDLKMAEDIIIKPIGSWNNNQLLTKDEVIIFSCDIEDKEYIKSVTVNGEAIFLLNSLKDIEKQDKGGSNDKKVFHFDKQLFLSQGQHPIRVEVKNILMGDKSSPKTKELQIYVDRLGPMITVKNVKYDSSNNKKVIIEGYLNDDDKITDFFINEKKIPIEKNNKISFTEIIDDSDTPVKLITHDELGNETSTELPLSYYLKDEEKNNYLSCSKALYANAGLSEHFLIAQRIDPPQIEVNKITDGKIIDIVGNKDYL